MTVPSLSERFVDPHAYPKGVAYQDGQYIPVGEAKVSVLDWGFLHSDATYDTVHVWNGRFFRLDWHMDRFFGGLDRLRMTIPYDRDRIAEILANCVALADLDAAYVEMLCTRGTSPTFSRDPRAAENRFMAFAVPFGSVANREQMRHGLSVAISSRVRIPPRSVDPAIKNYHWLDLVGGLFDAYDRGAETALVLDENGHVAEGPGFNVFIVEAGRLSTPAFGVLGGITRRTVFEICAMLSIECRQDAIAPERLAAADEVFITSTAGGIMPVSTVDGAPVGEGRPGPVTETIRARYWDLHDDPAWSTAVDALAGNVRKGG